MFKILQKTKFIRAFSIVVIAMAIVAIGTAIINNKTNFANATNSDEGFIVEIGYVGEDIDSSGIHYGSKEMGGSRIGTGTHFYNVTYSGNTITAYCANPSKGFPTNEFGPGVEAPAILSTSLDTLSEEQANAIKLFIYAQENDNKYTQEIREYSAVRSLLELWGTRWGYSEDVNRYAVIHAVVGGIYDNDYKGLNEEEQALVNDIYTYLKSSVNNNSRAWGIAKNYNLYFVKGVETDKQDVVWIEGPHVEISLSTIATDKDDGDKVIKANSNVIIKDNVKYCLEPGFDYTIKGVLMDKSTQKAVISDGQPVTSEITFIPEETCGEVDMYYKLNTTDLSGRELVIFESLYLDGSLILEHRDFDNTNQTVKVSVEPKPNTPNTGLFTNNSADQSKLNNPVIFVCIATTIGLSGYAISRFISRKNFKRFK